jgi:hypothetical protein
VAGSGRKTGFPETGPPIRGARGRVVATSLIGAPGPPALVVLRATRTMLARATGAGTRRLRVHPLRHYPSGTPRAMRRPRRRPQPFYESPPATPPLDVAHRARRGLGPARPAQENGWRFAESDAWRPLPAPAGRSVSLLPTGEWGCAPRGGRPHFPTIVPARPPREAMTTPAGRRLRGKAGLRNMLVPPANPAPAAGALRSTR